MWKQAKISQMRVSEGLLYSLESTTIICILAETQRQTEQRENI
jgi:hypothetical protein